MSFSTADCKTLLCADALLIGQGFAKADWKRVSKRNGPQGPERVFACSKPQSHHALVIETPQGLWIASESANADLLQDPSIWRQNPQSNAAAAIAVAVASLGAAGLSAPESSGSPAEPVVPVNWREFSAEADKMKNKAAVSLAEKLEAGAAPLGRVASMAEKGAGIALANQFYFGIHSSTPAGDGSPRFGATIATRAQWSRALKPAEARLAIEGILPEGALMHKNGRCEFPPPLSLSAVAIALEMTRRGFEFTEYFVDSKNETLSAAMEPLRLADAARAKAEGEARKAGSSDGLSGARPSWRDGPRSTDKKDIARAERLMAALTGVGQGVDEDFDDEDDELDEPDGDGAYQEIGDWANQGPAKALALANQFLFFVTSDDMFGGGPTPTAIISPAVYTEKENCIYDQECPIEGLLPDDAEDLNGCGTWMMHGYSGTMVELVHDLIARGFHFSEKMQREYGAEYLDDLTPLWEADDLEKTVRATERPARPGRDEPVDSSNARPKRRV